MRIPGDFGMMPSVDPDIIEFSVNGKRLSADITSRRTGTGRKNGGLDSGARARIEQRLAGGFYYGEEMLAGIAEKLLDLFGI